MAERLGARVWRAAYSVVKYRQARPVPTLPTSKANDAIAVVGGLALYALFVLWLHAKWFGVSPIAFE